MTGEPMAWPRNWSSYLGTRVTLEGKALNAKSGALLMGDGGEIWIDGLDAWPPGFYLGGQEGRRVRVTGTVISRHDLPAFIDDDPSLPRTGIPVPPGGDLERASQRYLLQGATWEIIE